MTGIGALEQAANAKGDTSFEWSYLERVREYYATDRGRLAALKRGAGETIGSARNVAWIYSVLPRALAKEREQEIFFMVACLFAFDKTALERGMFYKKNFGATMAWLKLQPRVSEDSVDRRFRILLDSDFDPEGYGGELAYRLRQTVRYVLSQGGMIDWPQLLADLRRWNYAGRRVQKDWAKAFYDPAQTAETSENAVQSPAGE
jgi:CRISPR type I-E-associated protein CasB/Cse2